MAPEAIKPELKKLEDGLKQCEDREDFLGELDIYEEIERKGMTAPRHLVGLGLCLMKVRRKQDAREAWIKAHLMDAKFEPATKALDANFPGWRKTIKPVEAPKPQAPSPPPQSLRPNVSSAARSGGPPPPSTYAESAVNWAYIMEDVAEARTAIESKALNDAASI